jgi:hypothetical protein
MRRGVGGWGCGGEGVFEGVRGGFGGRGGVRVWGVVRLEWGDKEWEETSLVRLIS